MSAPGAGAGPPSLPASVWRRAGAEAAGWLGAVAGVPEERLGCFPRRR